MTLDHQERQEQKLSGLKLLPGAFLFFFFIHFPLYPSLVCISINVKCTRGPGNGSRSGVSHSLHFRAWLRISYEPRSLGTQMLPNNCARNGSNAKEKNQFILFVCRFRILWWDKMNP